MGVMSKYNKGNRWNVDTKGFKFMKLSEVYKSDAEVFPIKGVSVFSTKYGDSAVAIMDDKFINLPNHTIEDIRDMVRNDEVVKAIKDGKVGFTIHTYEDAKHNRGLCYGINWVDID